MSDAGRRHPTGRPGPAPEPFPGPSPEPIPPEPAPPPGPIPVPPVRSKAMIDSPKVPPPDGEPKQPAKDRDDTAKSKITEVQDPLIAGDAGKAGNRRGDRRGDCRRGRADPSQEPRGRPVTLAAWAPERFASTAVCPGHKEFSP